ncbi:jg26373, partial [Pararge aegeria aegeria]
HDQRAHRPGELGAGAGVGRARRGALPGARQVDRAARGATPRAGQQDGVDTRTPTKQTISPSSDMRKPRVYESRGSNPQNCDAIQTPAVIMRFSCGDNVCLKMAVDEEVKKEKKKAVLGASNIK